MKPGPIIEALDEGEYVAPGVGPRRILTVMDELRFESVKEALHRCIVEAVSFAAHRSGHAGSVQCGAIVVRCVLHPAIRMMDEPRGWPLPLDRHHQRGCRQFSTQMIAHCP